MTSSEISAIIEENARRRELLEVAPPDPLLGDPGASWRRRAMVSWSGAPLYIPAEMTEARDYSPELDRLSFERMRVRYDFEFWCARCVRIRDKLSGQRIPFVLNGPQRRVAAMLEADRREGRPLRLIMLKARQWGGSTLIQMYFAWIQLTRRRSWNSLICAQVKDTAGVIRGMYDDMLADYPEELWDADDGDPRFTPWKRSQNTRAVAGRDCRVTVCSSFGQDATRGFDISMAHLSEVAFWNETDRMKPGDFIRSVTGGIPREADTVIAMESTANGVGNYFHRQWLSAEGGKSAYRPVFVPWYEIEIYREECPDKEAFISSWTNYEQELWERGLTIEMIWWYRGKLSEFQTETQMHAEFPSTPTEAFENTGHAVFAPSDIDNLRAGCREPLELDRSRLTAETRPMLDTPSPDGELKVWALPDRTTRSPRNRYVIAVDVGGRSYHSDYSVVTVFDRLPGGACSSREAVPEPVAQWRGHCDHDLLAAYAARMGRIYGDALLAVESNTLESAAEGASQYILEELRAGYRNLYVRMPKDTTYDPSPLPRVGFHTNRSTKSLIITGLIAAVRDGRYRELDSGTCNELATYELRENGSYAARPGFHDDLLMTRAIGLYIISGLPHITIMSEDELTAARTRRREGAIRNIY